MKMKKYPFYMIALLFGLALSLVPGVQAQKVNQWPSGVSYEIFVLSFYDSDGDGKGDIKGMTSRLDYLQNLGISAIWLMPINPSPSYHKYDVTDYYGVHSDYGTSEDFRAFVKEAHKRNIKVVIDMVLNHCSHLHPWFIDATKNAQSPYHDYFVWKPKDDPEVKTFITKTNEDSRNRNRWNMVTGREELYYSYFGPHMPDLNYDNPALKNEVLKIGRFWLQDMDIDGFRLDAARHIFPEERAPDSQAWWQYFLKEMQKVKKDVYLVGEVWASTDQVAPYLKGIPALFNFDMASAIKKAVNDEKGDSLAINLAQIESIYAKTNPDFIDATFLSNHDQNRLMSSVNNDPKKARMAAALLFTLPGSPYIYYGEELGMTGKKPDEQIREPFLWDIVSKDKGRTTWIKPRYNTDSTIIPAALQLSDKHSLASHYQELIALRNASEALSYGNLIPVSFGNASICAFQRNKEKEQLLVVHNLSKTATDLDLHSAAKGYSTISYATPGTKLGRQKIHLEPFGSIILKK